MLVLAFGGIAVEGPAHAAAAGEAARMEASDTGLRGLVEQMKRSPRGPFEAVRWFCNDGSVQPPKAGACSARGGGIQHGLLGPAARRLRDEGFSVGQVVADLDPQRFVGSTAELGVLRQLVLERFLVLWDDGWIFRGARSYRGAIQVEDEEANAERILLALLGDPDWLDPTRFLLLREVARAVPLPGRSDLAAKVRALAAELGDADPDFQPLRARIHSWPSAADAALVRAYGRKTEAPERYEPLARTIDSLFDGSGAGAEIRALADAMGGEVGPLLAAYRPEQLRGRLTAAGRDLAALRRALPHLPTPAARLAALRASLLLEAEVFASAQGLLTDSEAAPNRRDSLERLDVLADALFGAGLIGNRHVVSLHEAIASIHEGTSTPLGRWRDELAYLARATEWSRRWLGFHFGPAMQSWSRIDPQAQIYEADRLRGSPLLAYASSLDQLIRDAWRLSGVQHRVFGEPVGIGVRGLNPGLGRGRLWVASTEDEIASLPKDAVALLPETTSHLPPVAAILTRGEGSSVSHVQLLARNLGIPNAVVDEALAQRLAARAGEAVEVAVSARGVVQVDRIGDDVLEASRPPGRDLVIRIDEAALALDRRRLLDLDELRSGDSGRVCGPKAANLGALRQRFPDLVPDGFVIPFGVFRGLLDRPLEPGGPSAFEWLRASYARVHELTESEQPAATAALLARIRDWIGQQTLDAKLQRQIARHLGELGGGVFVRSDTNVEDLAGFTGAGLNLTVPNVVGAEAVVEAVLRVWASPFGDRAHAWRQAYMERPELVFPSVLVQLAFPAHKSGVMVTVDVDTGLPGVLSIATGEGVGGAVDGQATESIRVDRRTGHARFLAQATAPVVADLDPAGGVVRRPASGAEWLLGPAEIEALRTLAERVEGHPALRGPGGESLPADVEFAFRDGRLALLQLRPFVESPRARASERLRALDAPLEATAARPVPLDETPGETGP